MNDSSMSKNVYIKKTNCNHLKYNNVLYWLFVYIPPSICVQSKQVNRMTRSSESKLLQIICVKIISDGCHVLKSLNLRAIFFLLQSC